MKYLSSLFLLLILYKVGNANEAESLNGLIEHRTQLIIKKCVEKAKEIREERVCESKKEVIKICLHDELKTKDIDKAQKSCEHLYIL
jgi:hypothetical protein